MVQEDRDINQIKKDLKMNVSASKINKFLKNFGFLSLKDVPQFEKEEDEAEIMAKVKPFPSEIEKLLTAKNRKSSKIFDKYR